MLKNLNEFISSFVGNENRIKGTIFILVGFVIFKGLIKVKNYFRIKGERNDLQEELMIYKKNRKSQIEDFLKNYSTFVSNDKKNIILNCICIKELNTLLRSKTVSVKEVVITFLLRVIKYGEEYCWNADFNLEESVRLAEEADKNYELLKDNELFGIPFSIKDNIHIKKFKSCFSYIRLLKINRESDSQIVKVLKSYGSIPIIKGNVPQGFMSYDSYSHPFGKALNPFNKSFLAGGSSGGDAGLVSSKCVLFAIGSDLGGSIRIPSLFCGVFGLKPTSNKLSKIGSIGFDGTGNFSIPNLNSSYGPITRNVEDLILVSKNLFGKYPKDLSTSCALFNDKFCESQISFKVGYFFEDDFAETSPCIKSKLSNLISSLDKYNEDKTTLNKQYGIINSYSFTLIDLNDFINKKDCLFYLGYELLMNSHCFELIEQTLENFGNEEKLYFIDRFSDFNKLSNFSKKLRGTYLGKRKGHYMLNCKTHNSVESFMGLIYEVTKKKNEFLRFLNLKDINTIMFPTLQFGAIRSDLYELDTFIMKTMFIFNLLDLPCTNIPLGLINDCSYESKHNDSLTEMIKMNLNSSKGLPCGVQISCFGFDENNDEATLMISKDCEKILKYSEILEEETKKRFFEENHIN